MSKLAEDVVQVVLHELYGRKGFDWWWDDLDETTRGELTQSLENFVQRVFVDASLEL